MGLIRYSNCTAFSCSGGRRLTKRSTSETFTCGSLSFCAIVVSSHGHGHG